MVSASTLQSPVLLMLLGMGIAEDIGLFGSRGCTRVLPGRHDLQDHCMAQLNYETDQPSLFGAFVPPNFELFETEVAGR